MARALGVTRATIGHAVAELATAGLVLETPTPTPERIGRPGVALRLNPQGALFIGVEIDTRAVSAVLLDLTMRVIARKVDPVGDTFQNPQAMVPRILSAAQSLAAHIDPARLVGLGVAVPGLVGRHGQVVNAPLLGWRNFALQEALQDAAPAARPRAQRIEQLAAVVDAQDVRNDGLGHVAQAHRFLAKVRAAGYADARVVTAP